MWSSRRRTEHADSRSLCELVSSFHPGLNLFTWNLKRGWITLCEENASRLVSIHQGSHALMYGHKLAGLVLAVTARCQTLWHALSCHKSLSLVALTGLGSGVHVRFDAPVMLRG